MPETAMSAAARAFAQSRRFSAATLDRWLRLSDGDQAALLRLGERLRLGENQFRDLLDWSEEIAVRDGCSVATVWAREPVAATLARDLGRNEMIAAVKSALRQLRFPQLAAAEARLAELVRRLKLPRGVRLQLPEHLEGDDVRIDMSGHSAAALRAHAAAVQRALSAPELDEIFRTLEQAP
ncbi:MAG TPA: hypothetical protein VL403_15370 [Candidatus Kryptonia bacterium]|nr:hypothetical protein [Candidatus Kryptonia bacterium]